MSTHPQNRFDPLTAAFVSNLENLILDFQPAAWISGHTHYCSDYRIGETHLISNRRGYSDLDDTGGFDPGLVIEVPVREVSRSLPVGSWHNGEKAIT
jgi:hypothetical protein